MAPRPEFDEEKAKSLIGKSIIAGITYYAYDDEALKTPLEQKQFYGHIISVDSDKGVIIKLVDSEETLRLPPQLEAVQKAPPGEYRFHSSSMIVRNPDFMTTWKLQQVQPKSST